MRDKQGLVRVTPDLGRGIQLGIFWILSVAALRLCALVQAGPAYGLETRPTAPPFYNLPATGDLPLPKLLSQTGLFTNTPALALAEGFIPYAVNSPLWSDGALKTRWLAVPYSPLLDQIPPQIGFSPTGEWTFPVGTVFVKHFDLQTDETHSNSVRRLETRLLIADSNGGVYGMTYRWRPDNSDADLVATNQTEAITITTLSGIRTQLWAYPAPADCLKCHTPVAGYVLGVKSRQLNGDQAYPGGVTDNQLRTLNHLGLFRPAITNELEIASFPRLVDLTAEYAPLEDRARSYIDANCAHCHRPGGVRAFFDARFDTPLAGQNLINGQVASTLGADNAKVITAKDIWRSALLQRVATTNSLAKMPPLARNELDAAAIQVLTAWINSLPGTQALPPPSVTPPGLIFNTPVQVTVDDDDDAAVIRYTLDGSLPSTNSLTYTGPFTVSKTATVRAAAFRDGYAKSVATTATFSLDPPPVFTLLSHTNNQLKFGWSVPLLKYVLEETDDVTPPVSWRTSPLTPTAQTGRYIVTLTNTAGQHFFRLRQ